MTVTVFHDIPDYFVERYAEEISAWAKNFRKIGPVKTIVLSEGQFAAVSPNEEIGAVLSGVRLIGKYERWADRMNVSPKEEMDRDTIHRHCRKMQRLNVPSRLFFKEPERPGLPFMPNLRANDNGGERK